MYGLGSDDINFVRIGHLSTF